MIVEDNLSTAKYLTQGLTENGFSVDIATNGIDGLHLGLEGCYACMIFDVMVPKLDGWSLVKQIRNQNITTPILFLTAQDSLNARVKGLELGADDYLIKPFGFSELLARIRALLRRQGTLKTNSVEKIYDLEIDRAKLKVIRKGKEIQLTAKEFQLLNLFMESPGEVLTRTFIAEQVWDINFDTDTNVIDVAIKRLRQKIEPPPFKKLIHSVRGVGYVFDDKR